MTTGAKTPKGIDTFADADSPDLGPLGLGVILNEIDALAIKKLPLAGTVDVVSNAAEVSLLAGGLAIPAGLLGPTGCALCLMEGDYLNNTGASHVFTAKAKFGGTTPWGHAQTMGSSATRTPFSVWFIIANAGATNSNYLRGDHRLGNAIAGSVAGVMEQYAASMNLVFGSSGLMAIDTTLAQSADVTVQHDASNASLSVRRHYAALWIF